MNRKWWKEAVVYQIYPRSFKDSNGDGIGDLQGIISQLDYVKNLGVDVVWLSPIFQSPNDDNGYDISDYYRIMPEFGTMSDFDELLAEMKQRNLRLVLDLVANHSSDEHAWFAESRGSKTSPKRDYYIWRPGVSGGPPNNWPSFFGGDAWEYDPATGEYYLHLFTRKQPDLNWENEQVRQEVFNLMRFWLDKGIDGFRMDVISLISKRNYDDSPYADFTETISKVYANGPSVHEFLKEMNREVMSRYDMMTVGEGPGITLDNSLDYVGASRDELNMIFHFDHMFIDHGPAGKFDYQPMDLVRFKQIFRLWDEKLKGEGWNSIFLGNHDFPRMVSRFGNDGAWWQRSAKALALLLQSMRGTPYVYQGDELGMTNVAFPSIEDYRDVETFNAWREAESKGADMVHFLRRVHIQGRDNARTPMQWSDAENAGFGAGEPWIKLNPNFPQINAAQQEQDPESILNFYRKMLALRKANFTLVYGEFAPIQEEHPQVFAFWRWDDAAAYLIAVNFSEQSVAFSLDNRFPTDRSQLLISNLAHTVLPENGVVQLEPWAGCLWRVR